MSKRVTGRHLRRQVLGPTTSAPGFRTKKSRDFLLGMRYSSTQYLRLHFGIIIYVSSSEVSLALANGNNMVLLCLISPLYTCSKANKHPSLLKSSKRSPTPLWGPITSEEEKYTIPVSPLSLSEEKTKKHTALKFRPNLHANQSRRSEKIRQVSEYGSSYHFSNFLRIHSSCSTKEFPSRKGRRTQTRKFRRTKSDPQRNFLYPIAKKTKNKKIVICFHQKA